MAKETLIVSEDELTEYGIFGWVLDKATPEGKLVLTRDNDDLNVKKFLNQEMKYRSIKSKIKKLEPPVQTKGLSSGLKLLIAILLFPFGLLVYFIKPGSAEYERELKEFKREKKNLEDQLEDIRLSIKYNSN